MDENYYLHDYGPRLWMPYSSYRRIAQCLNDVDITTQMYMFPQVLYHRLYPNTWEPGHRPTVLQWSGHERELIRFWEYTAQDFTDRFQNRQDEVSLKFSEIPDFDALADFFEQTETPQWRNFEQFHISQRKILLYHDGNYYKHFWPGMWNHEELFASKKFYPVWPSRFEAFWPNGQLPTQYSRSSLREGVTPEAVIDCMYESHYDLQTKESNA